MTTDLVQRLNARADFLVHCDREFDAMFMREAADEIEKLRKYVVSAVEKLADIDATVQRIAASDAYFPKERVNGAYKP